MMAAIAAEKTRRAEIAQRENLNAEMALCARDALHWFDHYLWTYDPRLVGRRGGAYVPFKLWPRQREIVLWMLERLRADEEGLIEKSRDTGVTYLCAAVALHQWLFTPGFKATFGSRKVDYVDKKDNPDSIFAKLRIMLRRLPASMLPEGFVWSQHDHYMRLVNPQTGAVISGEGGDDMGRGGRSSVYFVDEAAFVPNAETVEKALSGNTDCVIWVSSVNGMGNFFARKRHSILKAHQIARLHWRDDPRKNEDWAMAKKLSLSDPAAWASEYDIDYSASVEGVCIPAAWVESAKRLAAMEPRLRAGNDVVVGLDVGAGKAKSVAVVRRGAVVERPVSRHAPDTTDTALWALDIARTCHARRLGFDAPGVGAGVASTLMKRPDDKLNVIAINTGDAPSDRRWPDGRTSREMFGNLKAELWWLCREALKRSHEHLLFLQQREGGREHALTDLLALPAGDADSDALALQLSLVTWQRNERGRIVIEKKQSLRQRGIASPDHADALMLTFVEPRRSLMDAL